MRRECTGVKGATGEVELSKGRASSAMWPCDIARSEMVPGADSPGLPDSDGCQMRQKNTNYRGKKGTGLGTGSRASVERPVGCDGMPLLEQRSAKTAKARAVVVIATSWNQ